MWFYERIVYFIVFLINKYIGTRGTERWLEKLEAAIIRKYVSAEPVDPETVPTIQAKYLSNERFVLASNNYRNPVVIKGLLHDSNAVKRWDLDYLENTIRNFPVNVGIKDDDHDNGIRVESMPFNKFVEKTHNGFAINNNHTIFSHFPSLFDDIKPEFDALLDSLHSCNLRNIHVANLFISDNYKSSGTNTHCAGSGNFFCMIQGRKHWTLIDPKYGCHLKGRVASNGLHAQSLFDMPDTDISTQPSYFKHIPRYEVRLEPGDILWNAPWWWHRIRNEQGPSIGIAIRNNKVTWLNFRNNFTYTMSGWMYLLYNSFFIGLYEKMFLSENRNFSRGRVEGRTRDVAHQILDLVSRYPRSVTFDQAISV